MAPVVAPRRPASGSQVRADRTRALVIDETIRCILEEGFAAASAKHITERAGVTWGVVQYHFGDRDGLLDVLEGRGAGVDAVEAGLDVRKREAPIRVRLDRPTKAGGYMDDRDDCATDRAATRIHDLPATSARRFALRGENACRND